MSPGPAALAAGGGGRSPEPAPPTPAARAAASRREPLMGFMLMTRTRVTARARPRPAAPAPHLSRAGPPGQKSRQRNCHRASPGGGKRPGGATGDPLPGCGPSNHTPVFVFILSAGLGFCLLVPSPLISVSRGLTPYLHSRNVLPVN